MQFHYLYTLNSVPLSCSLIRSGCSAVQCRRPPPLPYIGNWLCAGANGLALVCCMWMSVVQTRWLFHVSPWIRLAVCCSLCRFVMHAAMFNDTAASMRFSTFKAILLPHIRRRWWRRWRRRRRLISIYAIEHYCGNRYGFVCVTLSLQFSFALACTLTYNVHIKAFPQHQNDSLWADYSHQLGSDWCFCFALLCLYTVQCNTHTHTAPIW